MNVKTAGSPVSGNNEPDKKNNGITKKFIISWKPCISFNCEAIPVPSAVNNSEINSIIKMAGKINSQFTGRKPKIMANTITTKPWKVAMVAPPKVLPIIILKRDTGATIVSFKNPNCLSQISAMPEKIAVKIMLMPIMPGTK